MAAAQLKSMRKKGKLRKKKERSSKKRLENRKHERESQEIRPLQKGWPPVGKGGMDPTGNLNGSGRQKRQFAKIPDGASKQGRGNREEGDEFKPEVPGLGRVGLTGKPPWKRGRKKDLTPG